MDNTEKIVRQFMSETKPFTYKDNDGRLMTDLANFFDWLAKKKQLTLTEVVKSFYCFEESMNMQLKCDSECDYCKSIKIEQ